MGWKMVYNFLGIDENIEKSTYIRSECPYSVFEHLYSVSKQKPRDYTPCSTVSLKAYFLGYEESLAN